MRFLSAFFLIIGAAIQVQGRLQVLDLKSQEPIQGAQVLIGYGKDNPFQGNVFQTDEDGFILPVSMWQEPLPVTVEAQGYTRATYWAITQDAAKVYLSRKPLETPYVIKGKTTSYGRLRRDGKIDFGLVLPALSREQMIRFNISTIMSPDFDTIRVIGRRFLIPSNISLPQQTESYILPLRFNKPSFRLSLNDSDIYTIRAIHGQFPLKKVIDTLRAKKPFTDVINFFKFKGHGEVKIDVKSPQDNLDIPVNQQSYKSHFSVKAPFFSKEKNFFVSVALSSIKEVPGEMTFLPTDLKKIEPGQTLQLTALDEDKKASYALSALVPNQTTQQCEKLKQEIQQFFSDLDRSRKVNNPFDDEFFFDDEFGDEEEGGLPDLGLGDFKGFCLKDRAFSVVFGPVSDVRFSAPNFLSLIPEPQVKGNQILLTPPSSAPQGIHPFATLLVLSEIEDVQKGKYKLEIKHRKWEVMAKGWVDRISLPDMTSLIAPNKKKTWEVIFLGSPDPTDKDVWNRDLSKVTHATRNSYRND